MKISFVIPCYKSSKSIEHVVSEIKEAIDKKINCEYEIILVNDASPDNTFEVIKNLAKNDNNIKAINLSKNSGQASATICGLRFATGDYIVCGDDDGQTPYCETIRLKEKLERENFDVVSARYTGRAQNSKVRNIGTALNIKMSEWILDQPKDLYLSAFFIARKFVIDEIIKYDNPYPYISGLLLRTTNNIGNVDVNQRERIYGKSGYSLKKLISLWMNGFTTFSIKPLRISSLIGLICAILGFAFGIVTIIRKIIIVNISVGWSSIIAILLFISGVLMLMLGMIGEYIGRIYLSINRSPQYVIKEEINTKNDTKN